MPRPILIGAVLVLHAALPAAGIEYRVATSDAQWDEASTWDPAGNPGPGDHCLIDDGLRVRSGDTTFPARLDVLPGATLRLQHDTAGADIRLFGGRLYMSSTNFDYELLGSLRVEADSTIQVANTIDSILYLNANLRGSGDIAVADHDSADETRTGQVRVGRPGNAFTGSWTVVNGQLVAAAPGCLGGGTITVRAGKRARLVIEAAGGLTEANGIVLEGSGAGAGIVVANADATVGALTLGGAPMPAGTYSNATHSAYIKGGGSITVAGGTAGPVKAFPEAEGFGQNATGGRGGDVYFVTNRNNSGSGSLRAALEASGPRTVIFRTGGTISLSSDLIVTNDDLTIAGQTAPGGGICLRNHSLIIRADNVIARHLRIRPGDTAGEDVDSLWIRDAKDVIVDHCSLSWSVDETFSISDSDRITLQWSLVTESLDDSVHSEGPHGKGLLIRGQDGARYSLHHNLIAHHEDRSPRLGNYADRSDDPDGPLIDFRNNAIYNWGSNEAAGSNLDNDTVSSYNFVANYYRPGPQTGESFQILYEPPFIRYGYWAFKQECRWGEGYFAGNWMEGDEWDDAWHHVLFDESVPGSWKRSSPIPTPGGGVVTDDAGDAYDAILAAAGAFPRDAADDRVIAGVISGGGKIIDSQTDVGGWPSLASGNPPADSDMDGMPDAWEDARGLNKNNPADGKTDRNSDGYTNLEEFLNGLAGGAAYEIAASAGEGGTIQPAGVTRVGECADITYTLAPDPYFHPAGLVVDGDPQPAAAEYSFACVAGNHTLHAEFAPDLTAAHPTPHWWLAQNGYGPDFEAAALSDSDRDGLAAWQEFRLQTDPRSAVSGAVAEAVLIRIGGNDYPGIKFRRPIGSAEVSEFIQRSADGTDWMITPTAEAALPENNGDGTETITRRLLAPVDSPVLLRVGFVFE